ncbi:MAG: transglycosylase SLT domain-containing protein [Patescibacteria group bacterium]|nr:transglycosylase SLT domain-containing protein [Patescibacteria group bacterium]
MRKVIIVILLAFILSVFNRGAYADYETITEEDIPKLLANTAANFNAHEVIPVPTPAHRKNIEPDNGKPSADNRSWVKSPYKKYIEKTAKKYNVDEQVIYATIMTESEGNPYAFRYEPHIQDASLGLGQVLISTARSLGFNGEPKELYKPEVSIDLIGKYYRNIIDNYGELTPLQLATAYNAGSPWKWPVNGHLYRFSLWLEETI